MEEDESEVLAATPPLRVLHVAERSIFDRLGRMLRHVVLALNAEGLRVSLLTDDTVATADLDGTPIGTRCVERLHGWRAWGLTQNLARWPEQRPDIVHVWGTRSLPSVGRWAARAGVRVLVHALSVRDVEWLAKRRLREDVRIAACCEGLADVFRHLAPPTAEPVTVLPPAMLMPDVPTEEAEANEERILGIIWAGWIDADAGLSTLVDAAAQLRRKECDLQVALVGKGPGVHAIWRHIRHAQVQQRVTLVHEPRSWDSAMRGADVCVVPARQQELSLAPLLAMAYGKVVLSSRDQIAEWFVESETTLQFTPGSAVELAYQLERVAEGHKQARELRRSAAAYVREHHTVGSFVTRLIAAYRALLGNEPAEESRVVEAGAS